MFRRNGRGMREFWIDAFCVVGLGVITLMLAQPRQSSRTNAAEVTKVTEAKQKVVYGDSVKIGKGHGRTWARLDGDGRPTSIGIVLDETALQGLPDCDAKTPPKTCCEGPEYELSLPKELTIPPYKQVVINWNPCGHEPVGVYDVPHFDFHFYTITKDERLTVTGAQADKAKECRAVEAELIPAGYINTQMSVRRMGNHWIDAQTPELHGKPFTATFLYGSCDGRITFIEPMITRAFLLGKTNLTQPIKQPAKFAENGYYPTSYSVSYDAAAKQYVISLNDLVWR